MKAYYFYLARCADGTLYAGSCRNVRDREAKHNEGTGAKYTRGRRPVKIVYSERFKTYSAACKREAAVKRLSREKKETLIAQKAQ